MKSTADPKYHDLGAGSVLFDRFDADGDPTGFEPLGNCDSFGLNITVEEIEKKDNTDGVRATLIKVITGTEVGGSIQLAEYRPANLAIALLGKQAVLTQVLDPVVDEELNGGAAIVLDRWYDLAAFNVAITAVEQGAVGVETPLTAADYEVNEDGTMIRILSTGAGTAARTIWSGTRPALTGLKVQGLTNARIFGRLRFISAGNQVSGQRKQVDVHRASLRPDGDLPFISEDFGVFTIQLTAERDVTRPVDEQYVTIVPLDELVPTGS